MTAPRFCSVECGAEGEANRRNLPCSESQHGKAIMSSSWKAGRREKFGGEKEGRKAVGERDMKT